MTQWNPSSPDEQKVWDILAPIDQKHLFDNIDKFSAEEKERFIQQVINLDKNYPGGLANYYKNALRCLAEEKAGFNPYEDYTPEIPNAHVIDHWGSDVDEVEKIGLDEIKHTVFVLVAGGLGERLGSTDIKVALPFELVTQECFLSYYIDYLMAFQKRLGPDDKVLLSIMTSDDTHDRTVKLLEDNDYFGMPRDQLSFMKQQKVPAMLDIKARFAQKPGTLEIETKPHGHGDMHTLIYSTGNSKKWLDQGKKWVCSFQDTNPLVFRGFPGLIGTSKKHNLEVNSMVVPRKVGEAADVAVVLKKEGEKDKTFLVEWANADLVFKKHGGEPVKPDGFSYYTTSINAICFSLEEYHNTLVKHQGLVAEFINPKYEDETKNKFKSSPRLETKMADYPRMLEDHSRMGITRIDRLFSFTTCKNHPAEGANKFKKGIPPECAGTCEIEYYKSCIELLKIAGVEVEEPSEQEKVNYAGIDYNFGAKIVLKPNFGVTVEEIKSKFKGKNRISKRSILVLDGDICIENLDLDGALKVVTNEVNHQIKDRVVHNKRYIDFEPVDETESNPILKMRGYKAKDANVFDDGVDVSK